MKRNYMRRLPLEETARHVGLTPSYFSKIFSEEIGAPYNHYLNKIRVEQSRSLLLSSDLSMVEISALCGFEDQSYFTKVFKRFTGITPANAGTGGSGWSWARSGRFEFPSKETSNHQKILLAYPGCIRYDRNRTETLERLGDSHEQRKF